MPQSNRTRADFVLAVYRLAGGLVRRGTATGGSTTTIVDSTIVATPTTYLQNKLVVLRPGTATQEVRYLGAWTSGSTSWVVATLTTACANADAYEIYDEAVATLDGVRAAVNTALSKVMRAAGLPVYNEELTVNDILFGDGQFEVAFTSGVPRNGTKGGAGTLSRDTTYYTRGVASMKMVNTAANALTCTWSPANYKQYAGKKLTLKANGMIDSTATSRLRLRVDDGVTVTNSSYYTAATANVWEALTSGEVTISASPTKLDLSVRVETGGAINAYVDEFRAILSESVREYPVRLAMDRAHALWLADSSNHFVRTIPPQQWHLLRGATPTLVFPYNLGLTGDRYLRLAGIQDAAEYSDDTTTVSFTNEQFEAVVANAIPLVLAQAPFGTTQASEQRLQYWTEVARLALAEVANNPPDQRRLR